jgi:hypothetical protein
MMLEVQLVAITFADGALAVMQFVTGAEFVRSATDDAINAEIAKAGLQVKSWRRIQPSDLPPNRTYRNAWIDDGKSITIDLAKQTAIDTARAIPTPVNALKALLVAKAVITPGDAATITG